MGRLPREMGRHPQRHGARRARLGECAPTSWGFDGAAPCDDPIELGRPPHGRGETAPSSNDSRVIGWGERPGSPLTI